MTEILKSYNQNMAVYSTATILSLGIEEARMWSPDHDSSVQRFVDGLRSVRQFKKDHPEAYRTACEIHGIEYIEQFLYRCDVFLHEMDIGDRTKDDFIRGARTYRSAIKNSRLSDHDHEVDFGSNAVNTSYRNFVNVATLDSAILINSHFDENSVVHQRCVLYGIDFVERFYHSRFYGVFGSFEWLDFLRTLYRIGSDPFAIDSHIIQKHKSDLRFFDNKPAILDAVQSGIPLEYALEAF